VALVNTTVPHRGSDSLAGVTKRWRRWWHWGTGKDVLTRQERHSLADLAERDDLGPTRRSPGRKDTRQWCRGHVGREHDPEIIIPENQRWSWSKCGPAPAWWRAEWSCSHVERCRQCGKVLRQSWQLNHPDECPDYQPVDSR
jgi:hypothetical protein